MDFLLRDVSREGGGSTRCASHAVTDQIIFPWAREGFGRETAVRVCVYLAEIAKAIGRARA